LFYLVAVIMSSKKDKLNILLDWVTEQIERDNPPRFSDVIEYAYRHLGFTTLTKNAIVRALRLHPAYQMNAPQRLKKKRWQKFRPIIVKNLGYLHGDIGFFSVTRDYETPKRFRSGFLVCKDILSRFTYISILDTTRDANSMIKALTDIFNQYKKQNPGLSVRSLAFDKEKSIMGNRVQQFLQDNNVSFHPFQNTRSKSKMAEGEIRIIRNQIRRLRYNKEQRWWRIIDKAVYSLNQQPIKIQGKFIKMKNGEYYTPSNINQENVQDFISKIEKAVPAYYFNQFMINPNLVKYKFSVGTFVRQKLIASSSAVIGEKKSDIALGNTIFVIIKLMAYVSKARTVEPLYIVENVNNSQDQEAFDEDEIAETTFPPLSSPQQQQ
jgi:hypothetical protein